MESLKTLATKVSLMMVMAIVSGPAYGLDEIWSHLQLQSEVAPGQKIFVEGLYRESEKRNQDLVLSLARASWVQGLGSWAGSQWSLWLGAAYLDFNQKSPERRLHQFLMSRSTFDRWHLMTRWGLEERSFVRDDQIYLRLRGRVQSQWMAGENWGPVFFNEFFYVPTRGTRVASGLNENRFGYGVGYRWHDLELTAFHVNAVLKGPTTDRYETWLHLMVNLNFH